MGDMHTQMGDMHTWMIDGHKYRNKSLTFFASLTDLMFNAFTQLDHFAEKKAIHVVHVRVYPPTHLHLRRVPLLSTFHQPLFSYLYLRLDYLHKSLPQSVIDHIFIFQIRDRAGRIHHHSAGLRAVDRGQQQLLLQMGVLIDVQEDSIGFDGGVLSDDAEASAGGVEQDAVEHAAVVRRVLSAILTGHCCIAHTHAVEVELQCLESILPHIVSEQGACVVHELCDVRGLPAGGSRHVQNAFLRLWVQSQHRQQRRRTLQHVVSSEVLRRGSQRHLAPIHLDAHRTPLSQWVQIHSSLYQCLGQFLATCLQSVCANRCRSGSLIRLHELHELDGVHKGEEMSDELVVVSIILVQQLLKSAHVVAARESVAQLSHIGNDGESLLDLQTDDTYVRSLLQLFLLFLLLHLLLLCLMLPFLLSLIFLLSPFLSLIFLSFIFFVSLFFPNSHMLLVDLLVTHLLYLFILPLFTRLIQYGVFLIVTLCIVIVGDDFEQRYSFLSLWFGLGSVLCTFIFLFLFGFGDGDGFLFGLFHGFLFLGHCGC